ncbi:Putative amidase AmiB2 [Baekduia alba]|uniref:amidase n=1 Tax=Baekduia alba TaxID=2997333 RepID=UPI002341E6E2|nr:amidase [Baekduia alba]WCB93255.1 Putative amidase AmiB2 [Baekduia alba]
MDATTLALAGAAEQARLIRAKEVSSREVVEATLARIAQLDPTLNAFRVVLVERALVEAQQADGRAGAGDASRPLLGVPVAIKDDVDVAGEATAWGTAAHAGPVAQDAEAVRRLRAAGAVIVGKTLVPELTMLPATDTTTFGSTRNPWDLSRTPGGSSGGSAAAMAAGLAGVALGSDGAGSIRTPSAWTGLFGLKPTRDRVPVAPHDDAWQGLSVNGPLARRVADAALFLDATIDGGGFADAAAREPRPLRVAVSTKAMPGALPFLGNEEKRAVHATGELLRSLGHEVVERDPDYPKSLYPAGLVRVLRGVGDDVGAAMPHPERLETRTRRVAAIGAALPAGLVRWARQAEAVQTAQLLRLWDDVDVLVTPCAANGPYRAGAVGRWGTPQYLARGAERLSWMPAWNVTGQPAAAVPAGLDDDGLPVGVQLVGRHGDDALLVSLSAQVETAQPWIGRRPGGIA